VTVLSIMSPFPKEPGRNTPLSQPFASSLSRNSVTFSATGIHCERLPSAPETRISKSPDPQVECEYQSPPVIAARTVAARVVGPRLITMPAPGAYRGWKTTCPYLRRPNIRRRPMLHFQLPPLLGTSTGERCCRFESDRARQLFLLLGDQLRDFRVRSD